MPAIALRLVHPAKVALRSLAQVFLQGSALTGACLLAGLAFGLPSALPAALLGLLSGVLVARLFRASRADISHGLYGYNGALVGLALQATFDPGWQLFALIACGGGLTSLAVLPFRRGLIQLPALTAPFVLVGWAMLAAADVLQLTRSAASGGPHASDPVAVLMRGIAQVMFQDQALAGLFFLVGITACSRRAGVWALTGSAVGLLVASVAHFPNALADGGLYGFNAALAAIVLSGGSTRVFAPLAGIVLSVFVMRLFQLVGVIALTAPFVISVWMTVAVESVMARRLRTSV